MIAWIIFMALTRAHDSEERFNSVPAILVISRNVLFFMAHSVLLKIFDISKFFYKIGF